jgi:hypothetical protein
MAAAALPTQLPYSSQVIMPWLQSEMETVLGLVRKQMNTRKNLQWTSLANSYNRIMVGTTPEGGGEDSQSRQPEGTRPKEGQEGTMAQGIFYQEI